MMQVIKENGKVVEVDCDNFADESVPNSFVLGHCMDDRGYQKCIVFKECWSIYTRRRSPEEVI